ncbi:MAG: hypothetical protein GEV28_04535 [Actinophytocola sp.]|uniref:hypothetical protein n=1 Tax=Actinophytocola sp. TaxID=1872138 RepID=UPI001320B58F|nr:hypothetical protein [Actinophytocola sp.]MPZ79688.1 hypothetical protein [Actinophytocola sp.]
MRPGQVVDIEELLAELVVAEENIGAHYVDYDWRGTGWAPFDDGSGCATGEYVLIDQSEHELENGEEGCSLVPDPG